MRFKIKASLMSALCLSVIVTSMSSCVTNHNDDEPSQNLESSTMELALSIPGLQETPTRSMTQAQESAIDYSTIQVLDFEVSGSNELFRHKATIINTAASRVTIQVPTSTNGEKYRFVVIANVAPVTVVVGTTKATAMNQFVFDCVAKWNASAANPAKIPLWGELELPIPVTADRSIFIALHRALARVDVGTLFKFNNPDPSTGLDYDQKETDKESVWGLANFKIKDVRVYRTLSKAIAASSAAKISANAVIAPTIAPTAKYNSDSGTEYTTLADADLYPLIYTLPAADASYIREIYVPESIVINGASNSDNVPCLVIGGYYGVGNTTQISYYRADFADYNNGLVTNYIPILRNHHYAFDIKTVNGPGFKEPEQALKSISSELSLSVLNWNETPLNFYAQGNYYLDIASRNVTLEARPATASEPITFTVPYNTNLDLDGVTAAKKIMTSWAIGTNFDVTIDYLNKKLTFTAKAENVNAGGVRSDVLTLQVENLKLTINVTQKAFNLNYELVCGTVKVFGKYRENVPLNYTNYITLQVTSATDLKNEDYEVRTVTKNGIYFVAQAKFPVVAKGGDNRYTYTLKLEGQGTPVNEAGGRVFMPFTVNIISNSASPTNTSCSNARIIVGYRTKKILTIGANAGYRYGYMLEPNTGSRAFMDASINFGTDPNSTVTMEEDLTGNCFKYEIMTAGQGMSGETVNNTYLVNKLNTFKPDIILTGQAINYTSDVIETLKKFIDNKGVFIMINEYYPTATSINDMVNTIIPGVTGSANAFSSLVVPMQGTDTADPILNGPFGNMINQNWNWGSDGTSIYGFTGIPASCISYSTGSGSTSIMFRSTDPDKHFFFNGDGGFISNAQRYIGAAYPGSDIYCPFAINSAYQPIARTNYTSSGNQSVYNSQIFGNIMTWAIDLAETDGIDYITPPGVSF